MADFIPDTVIIEEGLSVPRLEEELRASGLNLHHANVDVFYLDPEEVLALVSSSRSKATGPSAYYDQYRDEIIPIFYLEDETGKPISEALLLESLRHTLSARQTLLRISKEWKETERAIQTRYPQAARKLQFDFPLGWFDPQSHRQLVLSDAPDGEALPIPVLPDRLPILGVSTNLSVLAHSLDPWGGLCFLQRKERVEYAERLMEFWIKVTELVDADSVGIAAPTTITDTILNSSKMKLFHRQYWADDTTVLKTFSDSSEQTWLFEKDKSTAPSDSPLTKDWIRVSPKMKISLCSSAGIPTWLTQALLWTPEEEYFKPTVLFIAEEELKNYEDLIDPRLIPTFFRSASLGAPTAAVENYFTLLPRGHEHILIQWKNAVLSARKLWEMLDDDLLIKNFHPSPYWYRSSDTTLAVCPAWAWPKAEPSLNDYLGCDWKDVSKWVVQPLQSKNLDKAISLMNPVRVIQFSLDGKWTAGK